MRASVSIDASCAAAYQGRAVIARSHASASHVRVCNAHHLWRSRDAYRAVKIGNTLRAIAKREVAIPWLQVSAHGTAEDQSRTKRLLLLSGDPYVLGIAPRCGRSQDRLRPRMAGLCDNERTRERHKTSQRAYASILA